MKARFATAAGLAAALVIAGCGSGNKGTPQAGDTTSPTATTSAPTEEKPVTLNVSLMKDSVPDAIVEAAKDVMKAAHPNVTVEVQIMDWTGRGDKWTAALGASPSSIDVMEMGNTDILTYATDGALAELDGYTFENQDTWVQSLKDAGTLDGKLYGVPYYAGARVVWYNTDMWSKAGLTTAPTTLAEFTDAASKLATSVGKKDFSPLYFPGKNWYVATGFVYDTGGSIAKQDGGKWVGNLSSPESVAGLNNLKSFVKAVSKAPADVDETNDGKVFAQGGTAMVIDPGWYAGSITKEGFAQDKLGAFVMPGAKGSLPMFLGGSNFAVAANSANKDLAAEFIKAFTSTAVMTKIAENGAIPNTTTLASSVPEGPARTAAQAAARSWFTPTSTAWATVENGNVMQDCTWLSSRAANRSSRRPRMLTRRLASS